MAFIVLLHVWFQKLEFHAACVLWFRIKFRVKKCQCVILEKHGYFYFNSAKLVGITQFLLLLLDLAVNHILETWVTAVFYAKYFSPGTDMSLSDR